MQDECAISFVLQKKFGNNTYYKVLVQFPVELLPPSMDNCGSLFNDATMTCGVDNDDAKVGLYDTDFCMVSLYLYYGRTSSKLAKYLQTLSQILYKAGPVVQSARRT